MREILCDTDNIYSKSVQLMFWLFFVECKTETWWPREFYIIGLFMFLFDGDNKWTIEVRLLRFCVETDDKRTYKTCVKQFLYVLNYKYGTDGKHGGYLWLINVVGISTRGNYAQK